VFHGLNESGGSLVVENWRQRRVAPARIRARRAAFSFVHRGAQNRRFLQIGFGLLQRGLKLRQRRRQGSGLHHDLGGGEPFAN
jgi:hypothetical protein